MRAGHRHLEVQVRQGVLQRRLQLAAHRHGQGAGEAEVESAAVLPEPFHAPGQHPAAARGRTLQPAVDQILLVACRGQPQPDGAHAGDVEIEHPSQHMDVDGQDVEGEAGLVHLSALRALQLRGDIGPERAAAQFDQFAVALGDQQLAHLMPGLRGIGARNH